MKSLAPLLLVIATLSIFNDSARCQSNGGWERVREHDVEVEVPTWCSVKTGVMPGHCEEFSFAMSYISALASVKDFFVSAWYGDILNPVSEVSDESLDYVAQSFLKEFFGPLSLPYIDDFACDPSSTEVSSYKSLGQAVRETTALSLSSGKTYKIFFVFALQPSGSRLRICCLVVGCPEEEISEYNRVMSVILDSFTVR
jgi:hypothetical protein